MSGGKGGGGSSGFSAGETQQIIDTQARANRVNQITPFGSLRFTGSNRDTARLRLSPEQQAILEQQQIGQLLGAETATGRLGDLGASRQAVEQATFDRLTGLLSPEFERDERRLRQRLANQGLPQTSGAFDSELERFEDRVDRRREEAALASIMAGGQEESRVASMVLGLLGAGNPNIPLINVPQVTVPVNQPTEGANPMAGLLGLGGLAVGGLVGGVPGAGLGFAAGSQAPGLLGF